MWTGAATTRPIHTNDILYNTVYVQGMLCWTWMELRKASLLLVQVVQVVAMMTMK